MSERDDPTTPYYVTQIDPGGNASRCKEAWSAETLATSLEIPISDLPESGSGRDLYSARNGSVGWMLKWRRVE